MPKKIVWLFDEKNGILSISNESKEADSEKAFSFKLTRYKDSTSHEESLKITCYYDDGVNGSQNNGNINTHIYDLDKDLKGLMKYGVAFSGVLFSDLQQQIQKVYLQLTVQPPEKDPNAPKMVDDSVMQEILSMIGECIKAFDFDDKFYNIPVEQFNQLIEDSEYRVYSLKEIKIWLADQSKGYTKCGKGRLTNIVRIKDKPTRVISFYADKIEKYIPRAAVTTEDSKK